MDRVSLQFTYAGSREWDGWSIKAFDLNGLDAKPMALIPEGSEEGALKFKVEGRLSSDTRVLDQVRLMPEKAASFTLSARIFKTYEGSTMTRGADGIYRRDLRARRDDLPVFIDGRPTFTPGLTYRVRIVNDGEHLRATIEKVTAAVSASGGASSTHATAAPVATLSIDPRAEAGKRMVKSGLSMLASLGVDAEALSGLRGMISTLTSAEKPDPTLDALSKDELVTRFETKKN